MSLGNNQQLARKVASAIEHWNPSKAYGHESKFQNELQEYLDQRLNEGSSMMFAEKNDIIVEREHGNVNGDVVVNGSIGIELKRDLNNSQTKKLRGQIEEYKKEYTHVIALACGIDDMDGWRKLKNDYENGSNMGMDPNSAPVKFIHKSKSNYGEGKAADSYLSDKTAGSAGGLDDSDGIEEVAKTIVRGIEGYNSLTGDGSMGSGEAVLAIIQATVIIGVIVVGLFAVIYYLIL
ncbi:hypothetical protein [Natronomonas salsuginis]|uniref:Uncharacterized protein n=1 Tax=Natronomonas salsuginis TaxID=2217661 RepID=A0A4U5JFE8_9EURY|nr:hypothetical protein [Natronomonas salsuginis]TKR27914.1 hypothetical protein DM868_02180 [Natronomonas salsuginis]